MGSVGMWRLIGHRSVSAWSVFRRSFGTKQISALCGHIDRYNGIHVDVGAADVPTDNHFVAQLKVSLDQWLAEKRSAVWLHVPVERSSVIAHSAELGFCYHHAEGTSAVLCLWLQQDTSCKIPPFATHQVGVAGCVINCRTSEVLVIRERNQLYPLWKFPGGLSDVGEDIGETAKREIMEETGLYTALSRITKLWVYNIIKPTFLMMRFCRASHEGDWPLHIKTAENMLPYMFAAHKYNYGRYGLFYLWSMTWLGPEIFDRFCRGEQSLHHTAGTYNGQWSDMFMETNWMRKGHGPGGIIGTADDDEIAYFTVR